MTAFLTRRRIRIINQYAGRSRSASSRFPSSFPSFGWSLPASRARPKSSASPSLVPREWQWRNFIEVFTYQPFARQYFNSLYIAVTVTALTLLISSLAGYALARMRFAGAALMRSWCPR